ncbi:alpha-glucosidase C-terminal domain-containing protein, partial [Arthrospira platensis SPKY1]|nr:alpha-glucosidase C-terminal domain-containing protein [Arthrospira platensis SPKY1]
GRVQNLPFFSNQAIDWTANPDMLEAYQTLMQFYTLSTAARRGTLTQHSTNQVIAFLRKFNDEEVLVIINPRNSIQTYVLPTSFQQSTWTNAMTSLTMDLSQQIEL